MSRMTTPDHAMELRDFGVDELTTYHRNARRGDVEAIARSLERNGQYRAIVVNVGTHTGRPLEVLAGNHTLMAARRLGWPTVRGTTVDVGDVDAARIVAADNRTADLGDYDEATLRDLLQSIDDLDGTGYTTDDLAALLADDAVPLDAGAEADYAERWELVVECESEEHQRQLFEKLTSEGLTCRVLTL